jgi:hypothetical protein
MEKIFTKLFVLITLLLWIAATILLTTTIIGVWVMVAINWDKIGEKLIDKLTS